MPKEFRVCKTCGQQKPLDEFTSAIPTNRILEDCKECRKGKHYTLVFAGDIETQEKAHRFLIMLSHFAAIARRQNVKPDVGNFIAEYALLYGASKRQHYVCKISDYRWAKIEELLAKGKSASEIARAYGFVPESFSSKIFYRYNKKKKEVEK